MTSLRDCLAEAIAMNRKEAIAAAGEHWQEDISRTWMRTYTCPPC